MDAQIHKASLHCNQGRLDAYSHLYPFHLGELKNSIIGTYIKRHLSWWKYILWYQIQKRARLYRISSLPCKELYVQLWIYISCRIWFFTRWYVKENSQASCFIKATHLPGSSVPLSNNWAGNSRTFLQNTQYLMLNVKDHLKIQWRHSSNSESYDISLRESRN